MGQKGTKGHKLKKNLESLTLSANLFDFKYIIGKGGFGKVWKVGLRKTQELFALKEMSKAIIIDKKSEKSIKYERDLLAKIKHPFIINMHYAFQDRENLYLVMDLLTGGDLRYHISKNKKFNEEQTKFFICCLILGLEYLHFNNVLHRDIKPENLVLDEKGYVRITDFGIAKIYQKENAAETSGTPGYMSPEVIVGNNHTSVVDYFALGVITYEFMMGCRPYNGKNRKEIKEKIIAKQIQVKKQDIPIGWSVEAADFINRVSISIISSKLLQRKPANRLGLRGAIEVKEHSWLKYYPWKALYEKRFVSPFTPPIGDNFDSKYCGSDRKLSAETKLKYELLLKDPIYKDSFLNFTFYGEFNDAIEEEKRKRNPSGHANGLNSILVKFSNPHLHIQNFIDSKAQVGAGSLYVNESVFLNQSLNNTINAGNNDDILNKSVLLNQPSVDKSIQIENKFIRLKQQSISSSNTSLLRQYKMSNGGANNSLAAIGYLNHSNSLLKMPNKTQNKNKELPLSDL